MIKPHTTTAEDAAQIKSNEIWERVLNSHELPHNPEWAYTQLATGEYVVLRRQASQSASVSAASTPVTDEEWQSVGINPDLRRRNAHLAPVSPSLLSVEQIVALYKTYKTANPVGFESDLRRLMNAPASPQGVQEPKCQLGCRRFTGGEVKHHRDCVYYPESLSKILDDLQAKQQGAQGGEAREDETGEERDIDWWVEKAEDGQKGASFWAKKAMEGAAQRVQLQREIDELKKAVAQGFTVEQVREGLWEQKRLCSKYTSLLSDAEINIIRQNPELNHFADVQEPDLASLSPQPSPTNTKS